MSPIQSAYHHAEELQEKAAGLEQATSNQNCPEMIALIKGIQADLTKMSYALATVDPQYGEMLGIPAAECQPDEKHQEAGKKGKK